MYLQEGDHLAIGQELAMLGSDSELHFSLSKTLTSIAEARTTSQQLMAKSKPPIMQRIIEAYIN